MNYNESYEFKDSLIDLKNIYLIDTISYFLNDIIFIVLIPILLVVLAVILFPIPFIGVFLWALLYMILAIKFFILLFTRINPLLPPILLFRFLYYKRKQISNLSYLSQLNYILKALFMGTKYIYLSNKEYYLNNTNDSDEKRKKYLKDLYYFSLIV
jgi:hypothetical protein